MQRPSLFLALFATLLLAACQNMDRRAPAFSGNALYLDYQISGEEGEDSVACRLQCRRGGPDGPTVLLSPGAVRLDSIPLTADSAGFSGIYYETERLSTGFDGNHIWQMRDSAGHDRATPFRFSAFSLSELPARIRRSDIEMELKNFPENRGRVHLLLIDTSWASNDLNIILPVHNGRVLVPGGRLRYLSNGPINLEMRYDEIVPLEPDARPGRLHITYTVRRSFDLED